MILPLLRVGFAMLAGLFAVVGFAIRRLIRETVVRTGGGAASSSDAEFFGSGETLLLFLEKPFVTFWWAGESLREGTSESPLSELLDPVKDI